MRELAPKDDSSKKPGRDDALRQVALAGYYSTDEALYYVGGSGTVFLVGDITTESAVWAARDHLPAEAEPSNLDPAFADELERSRAEHRIE